MLIFNQMTACIQVCLLISTMIVLNGAAPGDKKPAKPMKPPLKLDALKIPQVSNLHQIKLKAGKTAWLKFDNSSKTLTWMKDVDKDSPLEAKFVIFNPKQRKSSAGKIKFFQIISEGSLEYFVSLMVDKVLFDGKTDEPEVKKGMQRQIPEDIVLNYKLNYDLKDAIKPPSNIIVWLNDAKKSENILTIGYQAS